MEIQVDGGNWTSASILGKDLPTLWSYAALLDVGNGYHIINGRAADGAGHVEAPHKIAERIWYPWASPDLGASSLAFEPAVARPGQTVTATLTVRNGGFQEGYVAIQATLPAGLAPAAGALTSLDDSITYDPATGVITWPVQLLWPGDFWRTQFQAVVADGLPAGTLTAALDLHASWPNIDLLPPEDQQRFRDFEASATVSAVLKADPELPADRDVTAPHVQLDEGSLAFTNRLIEEDLLAGQRRQYRYPLENGIAVFNLLTTSGQTDLYGWLPGQSDVPTYTAEGSGLVRRSASTWRWRASTCSRRPR